MAFVLLIFLGGRAIIEGIRGGSDEDETPLRRHGFWLLMRRLSRPASMRWRLSMSGVLQVNASSQPRGYRLRRLSCPPSG